MRWVTFLWLCLFALPAGALAAGQSIIALVAASTEDAVREISAEFQKETGIEVNLSAGGSNALAQQIIHGAPADVFLSASAPWIDEVARQSLVAESQALLGNELVIVQPKDAARPIESPADLLRDDIKFVALAGETVPAGTYAQQALTHHKIYKSLVDSAKIVRGKDVRATLTYVVRGEADAGIVYASDALAAGNDVNIVYHFKPESHEKIIYPLALLSAAKDRAEARRFYEYLASDAAAEIFRRYGFVPLANQHDE